MERWTGVYIDAPGIVIRCRRCDTALIVVVERRGVFCVHLRSVAFMDETGPCGSVTAGSFVPLHQVAAAGLFVMLARARAARTARVSVSVS